MLSTPRFKIIIPLMYFLTCNIGLMHGMEWENQEYNEKLATLEDNPHITQDPLIDPHNNNQKKYGIDAETNLLALIPSCLLGNKIKITPEAIQQDLEALKLFINNVQNKPVSRLQILAYSKVFPTFQNNTPFYIILLFFNRFHRYADIVRIIDIAPGSSKTTHLADELSALDQEITIKALILNDQIKDFGFVNKQTEIMYTFNGDIRLFSMIDGQTPEQTIEIYNNTDDFVLAALEFKDQSGQTIHKPIITSIVPQKKFDCANFCFRHKSPVSLHVWKNSFNNQPTIVLPCIKLRDLLMKKYSIEFNDLYQAIYLFPINEDLI